jgi:hypothetical protein
MERVERKAVVPDLAGSKIKAQHVAFVAQKSDPVGGGRKLSHASNDECRFARTSKNYRHRPLRHVTVNVAVKNNKGITEPLILVRCIVQCSRNGLLDHLHEANTARLEWNVCHQHRSSYFETRFNFTGLQQHILRGTALQFQAGKRH